MTELDPKREEDEPAVLRGAAVEALQIAARQYDPKEFERLTRFGLALIERARAIGRRRRRAISETDMRLQDCMQGEEEPRHSRRLTAKFIASSWRLCSRRTGR